MKTRRGPGPLLASALMLAACSMITPLPGELAQAAGPVERHDWVVGLGYGVGRASVEMDAPAASTDTDWDRGASPQFHVGRMIGRHLMLGIEDQQWLNEGGLGEYKVRGNVQNVCLVLTAYPGRTADMTSGFFLRLGGGYAHGRLSGLEPYEEGANEWNETYEVIYKHDAEGWGATAGAGYELRVSEHFAAGITASYNFLSFDDDVFEEVEFFPGSLHFNWYF